MPGIAFTLPVVSGKEELDRQTLEEMAGSRREEYEAALRDAGITRQTIWHQETPNGTMAVVYVEAEDGEAAVAKFGSSDDRSTPGFVSRWKKFMASTSPSLARR